MYFSVYTRLPIATNPGGVKRPLKLTSMNFSTASASEDERGVTATRSGSRNVGVVVGSGGGVSSRASLGGGTGGGKPGVVLTMLDGERASSALSYGRVLSLPPGGSGIGYMRPRHER